MILISVHGDHTPVLDSVAVIFFYTFFEFLIFIFLKVNFSDLLRFLVAQNFIFSLDLQDNPQIGESRLRDSAGVDTVSADCV